MHTRIVGVERDVTQYHGKKSTGAESVAGKAEWRVIFFLQNHLFSRDDEWHTRFAVISRRGGAGSGCRRLNLDLFLQKSPKCTENYELVQIFSLYCILIETSSDRTKSVRKNLMSPKAGQG